MLKFADIRRQTKNEALQPVSMRGRTASPGGILSPRPLHRDLGNLAMQRLYPGGSSNAVNNGSAMNESTMISILRETTGGGEPLSEPTKTFMETSLGTNLGQVRLHTENRAERMTQTLGAEAFAVGRNIYFNAGRYSPESVKGKKLLAHELVHTIQQGFHDNELPGELSVTSASDPSERQAVQVSSGIFDNLSHAQNRPVSIQPLRTHSIQPTIQMSSGMDVAIYETKDHGDGYEDAPSETYKMEASSLNEAGNKLTNFIKAVRALGSDASIGQLSFYGHGAPGTQSVGAGEGWDSAKEISVTSLGAASADYKNIYAPLESGASVYMRGCNVGAGEQGLTLLQEVKNSCKKLTGKDIEAFGWTGKSYHMRTLWYDWFEQTGEKVSSSEKIPKITWEKLKEREKDKKK